MTPDVLQLLCCPTCDSRNRLCWSVFKEGLKSEVLDGVVWCKRCRNWYPIEDALLEFLPSRLAYSNDRPQFWKNYANELKALGLRFDLESDGLKSELQLKQQTHFDLFADDEKQSYTSYELTPFWLAADALAFDEWLKTVSPGKWLLDVGCAQGRSTFKWMDLDLNIVGFDISKRMIRQAIDRHRKGNYRANAVFFVADASRFPFADESFDYVLLYGVLHHLPNPKFACQEIARVLKSGGVYFGQENNRSAFRALFDLLQRLKPLWHEEGGPEEVFSAKQLESYFRSTDVHIVSKTSVFLPPHLIDLMPERTGQRLLAVSDSIGQAIPFLRNHGGAILIRGVKS